MGGKKTKWLCLAGGLIPAALIFLYAARDDLIIRYGIFLYRQVKRGFQIGTGIYLVLLLAALIKWLRKRTREKKRKRLEAQAELLRQPEENHLEPGQLKRELVTRAQWLSTPVYDSITKCISHLEAIDQYQERLANLIKNNKAESLADTRDVLDQIEQYLCGNTRKVLNYLEVYDPKDADDVRQASEKIAPCLQDNADKLEQTEQFLFAMADFLNSQGTDTKGPEMLEIYKTTILESLREY